MVNETGAVGVLTQKSETECSATELYSVYPVVKTKGLPMNQTLSMYQSVGASAFSNMACQMAPYFSTINPKIAVLTPGRAEVNVPFRKEITNHLSSVHAIALCNAAELAGGMMTEVSVPSGARWIPKGMTVEYLAKAKSAIHAIANGSEIDWGSSGDKVVPVEIFDEGGIKVFNAKITMNVKLA